MNINRRLRPRWFARWLADVLGYFWLPCSICGEHYAGFEWKREGHTLRVDRYAGVGVCPKASCGEECRRRNAEWAAP